MNDFTNVMTIIINFMKHEYSIYGFNISFWGIFMWVCVAGVLTFIICKIFE